MSELIRTLEKEREAYIASGSSEDKAVAFGLSIAIREIDEQPQLNDNQQIVLDWLKSNVEQDNASPMLSITLLGTLWESRKFNIKEDIKIDDAYCELDYKQQAQVLEVFAKWAQEQEDEHD